MSIVILDTSVFCNILGVPGRDQQHERALEELERHLEAESTLLLPMAAIYETGNHVARVPDGGRRRRAAERFVEQVRRALRGDAPWTPTPIPKDEEMLSWLEEFPNEATRGLGLADLSLVQIFHRTCEMHRARRVFIWSYDRHLQGYDRPP